MSDGRRAAQVKVDAQEREEVTTPAGTFKTIRYEVNLMNGVIYPAQRPGIRVGIGRRQKNTGADPAAAGFPHRNRDAAAPKGGSEMRRPMLLAAAILLVSAGSGPAQAPGVPPSTPLMPNGQVNELCGRLGELMEAGGVAIPDLQRAAAPVIENTRQNCIQLRLRPGRAQITYSLLTNLRAYLALADSVPKPFPFSEAAQTQLTELRNDANRLDAHFRALIENRDRQLTSPDPANLARYAEANRKLPAPAPGKPRVVFFGDSITDIWRLNEYFPDSDYLNRGISGQTAGQLVQRMQGRRRSTCIPRRC